MKALLKDELSKLESARAIIDAAFLKIEVIGSEASRIRKDLIEELALSPELTLLYLSKDYLNYRLSTDSSQ